MIDGSVEFLRCDACMFGRREHAPIHASAWRDRTSITPVSVFMLWRRVPPPVPASGGAASGRRRGTCGLTDRRERIADLPGGNLSVRLGSLMGSLARKVSEGDHSNQRALFIDHGKAANVRVTHHFLRHIQRVFG